MIVDNTENTLPSFHDDLLVGYEVDCEKREIQLHIRRAEKQDVLHAVLFSGVEGYHFENDAFGNIILDLEAVTLAQFMFEYGRSIAESYRMTGAPGPWAGNLDLAPQVLMNKGVRAFFLSSSYGMSGWILAREAAEIVDGRFPTTGG